MDLASIKSSPIIEEIVDVICAKTQNADRGFYRVEAAYFLGKMAACMRASINTKDRGKVPVNLYALALGPSGYGKGYSVNIMEQKFLKGFREKFLTETMPKAADEYLMQMAQAACLRNQTTEEAERDKLDAEYKRFGAYPFTFDSGTAPAVKQLVDRLRMVPIGSINLQIDEIGSNLINSIEVLNVFLELYDQGLVKQKLTKNTQDNVRAEDRSGCTPANMLLFGTPVKLLDGGATEDAFYSFLEIGYARRCLFALGKADRKQAASLTPEENFKRLTNPQNDALIKKWADKFTRLADKSKLNWTMSISDDTSIKLIAYKMSCEKMADALPEHEEIKKAELCHRYFKALKLAGALAFAEESMEVTEEHLMQAIKLVEESGAAFDSILTREKPYMKLAKFIASAETEVTHADLTEALPFYKSGIAARNEMLQLATAWGYKNEIIIKKSVVDGIEFFKGETLKQTDLNKLTLSWSPDLAYNYVKEDAPWNQLKVLYKNPGLSWCNHAFKDGHRCTDNVIPGFDLIVVDVDGTTTIHTVEELFKDYSYQIYTTKRHGQDGKDRFRLIFPANYHLELSTEDYKEFMDNVFKWLPFEVDESADQASKKWLTNDHAQFYENQGKLFDVLPFIPRTSRNETYQKQYSKIQSMGNLERWFITRIVPGNRNNQMFKYAMALFDSGLSLPDLEAQVKAFNKQLQDPLPDEELRNSILASVAKKYVS
jgi:hypothetical protein